MVPVTLSPARVGAGFLPASDLALLRALHVLGADRDERGDDLPWFLVGFGSLAVHVWQRSSTCALVAVVSPVDGEWAAAAVDARDVPGGAAFPVVSSMHGPAESRASLNAWWRAQRALMFRA